MLWKKYDCPLQSILLPCKGCFQWNPNKRGTSLVAMIHFQMFTYHTQTMDDYVVLNHRLSRKPIAVCAFWVLKYDNVLVFAARTYTVVWKGPWSKNASQRHLDNRLVGLNRPFGEDKVASQFTLNIFFIYNFWFMFSAKFTALKSYRRRDFLHFVTNFLLPSGFSLCKLDADLCTVQCTLHSTLRFVNLYGRCAVRVVNYLYKYSRGVRCDDIFKNFWDGSRPPNGTCR